MEQHTSQQQEVVNQIYEDAVSLMIKEKKSVDETKEILVERGLSEEYASIVVNNLVKKIKEENKEKAYNDMVAGALWCVGGTVATVADFGFIFWGAIVFGGIQFFRGVLSL